MTVETPWRISPSIANPDEGVPYSWAIPCMTPIQKAQTPLAAPPRVLVLPDGSNQLCMAKEGNVMPKNVLTTNEFKMPNSKCRCSSSVFFHQFRCRLQAEMPSRGMKMTQPCANRRWGTQHGFLFFFGKFVGFWLENHPRTACFVDPKPW